GEIGPRLEEMLQQQPGLEPAAAAELDDRTFRSDGVRHLLDVAAEDRQLGPRQVILIEFADLVEERRAALVIEILAGDVLLRAAKAPQHVVAESSESGGSGRVAVDRRDSIHQLLASRIPVNCQRASGGKKFRYVDRMCVSGVAHEPPRSTSWLHMN